MVRLRPVNNDIIDLVCHLFDSEKFRKFLISEYPIILIDEYQDTKVKFAKKLVDELIEKDAEILFGFFGDHWQRIYGSDSCGKLESKKLLEINKGANFRSDKNIVTALNNIRPDLNQNEKDPESQGKVVVFHSNSYSGVRRTGTHWKGDLPENEAKSNLDSLTKFLKDDGWEFTPEKSKILMLTNNSLADRQGYRNLASNFRDTDAYLKKNDHYIKFFADTIEPVCRAFEEKEYGEMFSILGTKKPHFTKSSDKLDWSKDLQYLLKLRETGTIGEVLDHLISTQHPRLSSKVEEKEKEFTKLVSIEEKDQTDDDKKNITKRNSLRLVKYSEVVELVHFIDDNTPFSTKHGVKGAEFENVLVVFGRGWNQYNWDNFLSWSTSGIPKDKEDSYERNRNLFYVACSRPKKRLALLFTQELSPDSIKTLIGLE